MIKNRFEVKIPRDVSLVLNQNGRGLHGLLCEAPDATDLIIAIVDAIVDNNGLNQKTQEINQIKDLAISISRRYSGHPKV